jgi:putative permease
MRTSIGDWFARYLADPEAVGLVLSLVAVCVGVYYFGKILTPVLASIVIAYLLGGVVEQLERLKIPHTVAVILVIIVFSGLAFASLFILLPLLWEQLSHLFNQLPKIIGVGDELVARLHERFPDYISSDQIKQVLVSFKSEMTRVGQYVLAYSLASLSSAITLIIYLLMVPLLVYFMLKDNEAISEWFMQFLPKHRRLIKQVWGEVNSQIGRYINAKVIEIIVVAVASCIVFALLGLEYAVLLGTLAGLSVLIPYIGATLATVPIVAVAYLQWGWSAQFAYLIGAHALISLLDSTVLATVLFSEAVELHPIAVIIAILVFGSLWGFWGIFFAIPLATVVKAIINAWPRHLTKEHGAKDY